MPPALKQVNRFEMFCDDDGDSLAMPPPSSSYHGRASEPAYRTGIYGAGNRSSDKSKEGYGGRKSREGSYSGQTCREGGRILEKEIITKGATNIPKGKHGEDGTKPILDEYLHNVNLTEAFNYTSELYQIETIHRLVEVVFNTVVEKDKINAGILFCYLLKNESLLRREFVKGVNAVLEIAEDVIDITNLWEYFANMLRTILVEGTVDLAFLKESSSLLLSSPGLAGKYASPVLTQMVKIDQATTTQLCQLSGLSLADFKVENCEQFFLDNKLDFLNQAMVNCVTMEGEDIVRLMDIMLNKTHDHPNSPTTDCELMLDLSWMKDISEVNAPGREDSDDEALYDKLCTYIQTARVFMSPHWYLCHTCGMVEGVLCCSVCASVCHRDNDVTFNLFNTESGGMFLLLLSSSGHIYFQQLCGESHVRHGSGGDGVFTCYKHTLQTLFGSNAKEKSLVPLSQVTEELCAVFSIQVRNT